MIGPPVTAGLTGAEAIFVYGSQLSAAVGGRSGRRWRLRGVAGNGRRRAFGKCGQPGLRCGGGRFGTVSANAVFNRLDAEPVNAEALSYPPVSPLRKGGKKTRRRRLSPLAKGG